LITQPQPGQLNAHRPGPGVPSFADALVSVHATALEWAGRQPKITAQSAPVLVATMEDLPLQDGRNLRANSFQLSQPLDTAVTSPFRRIDLGLRLSGDVSLCINLFQHHIDQGQALAMPADLRGELRRKWAAVTGYGNLELPGPIPTAWPEVADALCRQQAPDSSDMLYTLLHQELAFAMKTFGIFFGYRADAQYAADLRFAASKGHQGSNQLLGVEAIGLGASRFATDHQARSIEHVVHDSSCLEHPMQPETIISGFITRHDLWRPPSPRDTLSMVRSMISISC